MSLPLFSGRAATCRAPARAVPELMPVKMPSAVPKRRACSMESSSVMSRTSS